MSGHKSQSLIHIITVLFLGIVTYIPIVQAQGVLEEVLVTATKREASTQDIPISIETISGETLDNMGIENFNDLSATIPNFSVGFGITAQSVIMRGLGSGQERSFEQSVGMFVDGQYMPRSRQYMSPFFDVERVEVVRGPQSVIHGLNSTAGAVSTVTKKHRPGEAFTAEFGADYEFEFGGPTITAAIGGSPSDTLGIRIATKYSDVDGFFDNLTTGDEEGEVEQRMVRINAIWEPTSNVSIGMKYERGSQDTAGHVGEIFGTAGAGLFEPTDGVLNWKRSSEGSTINSIGIHALNEPGQEVDTDNLLLDINYTVNDHVLTVVAGHSEFDYKLSTDLDTISAPLLDASISETYEQDSVEFRVTSPTGEQLEYLAGVYYSDSELANEQPNAFGPGLIGPGTAAEGTGTFGLDTTLWSVFGQLTWNFNEQFRLTGGVRYSDEEKDVLRDSRCNLVALPSTLIPVPNIPGVCPNPLLNGFTNSRSSDNWMPEVVLQWNATDDVMLYAKWNESAKSGGFAAATNAVPATLAYNDEEVTGYEIGMKSNWFNGAAELNITLFKNDFKDLQVNSFQTVTVGGIPTTFPVISNAGKADSQGIEVDGRWAATDWLTIGGAMAYLDAEYDSFPVGPCNSVTTGLASCDLGGQRLPFAAEWSGSFYGSAEYPVSGNINFIADLNISFSDDYLTDGTNDPIGRQDSWTKVGARVGFADADDRWSVAVVGRNLTDEKILGGTQSFLAFGYFLGYLEPPRSIMLQGRYRFGGE